MGLAFIIKLDNVAGDMGARGPSMPDAGSDPPGVSGPEGMNNEAKRKWMKWVGSKNMSNKPDQLLRSHLLRAQSDPQTPL